MSFIKDIPSTMGFGAPTLPTLTESATPMSTKAMYESDSTIIKRTSTIYTVANPHPTAAPLPLRTLLASLPSPTPEAVSVFWILALVSTLVALASAYYQAKHLSSHSYWAARVRSAREKQYSRLWATRDWRALTLLCDQWLRGLIPGDGMWTAQNAASLRAKKDKSALRSLIRMGIYPLFIQDGGGPTTTLEEEGDLSPWGRIKWPRWKQSKRRAVFEFVVPRARGWMIEPGSVMSEEEMERRDADWAYIEFMDTLIWSWKLRRATRWRTAATSTVVLTMEDLRAMGRLNRDPNAPLPPPLEEDIFTSKFPPDPEVAIEVGTTSRFRVWLPFKIDRILRGGWIKDMMWDTKNWLEGGSLLNKVRLPIVRVEAPDDDAIELDKEILLIAQNMQLDQQWDEAAAERELREVYKDNDLLTVQ